MQIKDICAAVFIQHEQQGDHISLTGQKAVNIKGKICMLTSVTRTNKYLLKKFLLKQYCLCYRQPSEITEC